MKNCHLAEATSGGRGWIGEGTEEGLTGGWQKCGHALLLPAFAKTDPRDLGLPRCVRRLIQTLIIET